MSRGTRDATAPESGSVIHSDSPVGHVEISLGLTWSTRMEETHLALDGDMSTL